MKDQTVTELGKYYTADSFPKGLSRKVVESISHIKNEPGWLTEFRLEAFEVYSQKEMPKWG
ncbi:MAG TPA: Fe-S cluster assembly protein SufB, partial [Leptospiraceae bacterium]|nr:Fe-S cluster assembly protein SufB [Leptospiraceae bacterium]